MQKPIELVVKGKTLRGMYHYPDGEGIYPTVILFHGFTGNKLEPHRIFLKLSRRLTASGMAAVRFDFSGSGESDGDFEEMTFSSEVFEAQEILKFVSYLPTTDADRIGLVGLSMGGAIASVIAGKNPSSIKALVLWSAAGIETIEEIYRANEAKGHFYRNEQGQIDMGGLWLNENFCADLGNWNSYAALKTYPGPALILQGTGDEVVPPATAEQYQAALGGRARLIYIPEADHTFNRHPWEEAVLTETTQFLKQTLF